MDAISATKEIIRKQVFENNVDLTGSMTSKLYGKYSKIHGITNENIAGYLKIIKPKRIDRALSVMSGGDHPFNLAYYGFKNIDTFDSNELTEFFALGIKRSAFITYDYGQFLNFLNKLYKSNVPLDEVSDLINLFIPYMDERYRKYWKEIKDFNYKLQKQYHTNLNLFNLLLIYEFNPLDYIQNAYLKDKTSYNKLKSIIENVNIKFKCCDVTELSKVFKNKYDLILLSNILDYIYQNPSYGEDWKYNKLLEFEKSLMKLVNYDGIVALNYIFGYYRHPERIIDKSDISSKDLKEEKIITFPSVIRNKEKSNCNSAILIKKVGGIKNGRSY